MTLHRVIGAGLLAGLLAALPASAQTVLRFATSQVNPNEPVLQVMRQFAERVETRSEGKLKIALFPGDQLGAQKKVNEMIKSGARMLNVTDYGQLSQFVADLGIVAGPYIYGSLEDTQRLVASDVFAEMSKRLEAQGLKLIMTDGLFGYRHVIANKPVRTIDDIAGMTIRVPPSPIMLATFKALGARPTDLPWSEVYNALQTGVVDAAEANYGSLAGSKLYEVRKVVSQTGHQVMLATFVTSTAFFNGLPKDQQAILLEEGKAAGAELTRLTLASDAEYAEQLRANGVEIVTDVDVAAFAEKAATAYDTMPGLTPGIYQRVRAAISAR